MGKYTWHVERKDKPAKIIRHYNHVTKLYQFILRNPSMFQQDELIIHLNHKPYIKTNYTQIQQRKQLNLKETEERKYIHELNHSQRYKTFYHVTPIKNLYIIQQEGLIPQIGPRSTMAQETTAAIYVFNSLSDTDTAMGSWLGDQFDENQELIIIELELDTEHPKFKYDPKFYESIMYTTIYPKKIKQLIAENTNER